MALGFGFCRSASAEPISPFGEPIKAGNMAHHATRWDDHFGQGDRFTFDGGFRLSERLFSPNESCRFGLCHPGESLNFGGAFDDAEARFRCNRAAVGADVKDAAASADRRTAGPDRGCY